MSSGSASTHGNLRLHIGWGIGTLGASLLLNTFAALQAYFLTNVLGVAAATAAAVLAIAKLWDWVSNPLMGIISDRTQTPWGRRRPFLLLGGIVSGLAFALYFGLAQSGMRESLWFVVLTLALVGTGYTIFNVPYMAMPSELIDDYRERTKMMSWRVFFIGIGTLIGAGTAKRAVELLGGGVAGYASMGVIFGAAICFFMALSFFLTSGGRQHQRERQSVPFREQLRLGMQNRPFIALLGTKFTQLFGLFTGTAMMIYVVQYALGKSQPGEWILWFTGCSFVAQVASIPLWNRIALAIEKQRTYMLATVLFCATSLSWLLADPSESLEFFCLRAALKGFSAAGLLLMGQSMLPDVIEYDFRRTGLRREGIFSGLYSVVEKVASTLAPSILLLTYAWFGFNAKAPTQTEATIDGIRYAAAFLPCLYFGLSLLPLWFYRLTESELKSAPAVVKA